MSELKQMKPGELQRLLSEGRCGKLIDVRHYDEYQRVHVEGAECVPLPQLLNAASAWGRDEEIVLLCQSGQRARQGAEQLRQLGFTNLTVVEGGTGACLRGALPVVRGRQIPSLQQQTLIGAGMVILSGLVG